MARRTRPSLRNGFVYAIVVGERYVKIGCTNDLRKRLDHLQTHNPEPAVLFGAWRADSVTEAKIHRALLDHRVMREWYPWNDAVRREVERFAETHVCVEDVGEINAANEASNARAARKGRGRAREILRAASASTPTHANR